LNTFGRNRGAEGAEINNLTSTELQGFNTDAAWAVTATQIGGLATATFD